MKPNKINTMTTILSVLLFISLLFNYQYYIEKQEQKHQYKLFLNHFYFSIHHSLNIIQDILDKEPYGDQLNMELTRLSYFLNEVEHLLNNSVMYIKGVNSIGTNNIDMASQVISYGTEHRGKQIPSFGEDDKLNQRERVFLTGLKKNLLDIHVKLYSEETGQENHDLSKHAFNNIIRENLRIDDYYLLLDEYIDHYIEE